MNTSNSLPIDQAVESAFASLNLTPEQSFCWLDLSGCLQVAIDQHLIQPEIVNGELILKLTLCPMHQAPILKPLNLCLMCTEPR